MTSKEKNREWIESYQGHYGSFQGVSALFERNGKTEKGVIRGFNLDDELIISYGAHGAATARFKLSDPKLQEQVKIIRRITPEQVVARYKELGWKPIRDAYYDEIDRKPCGCGLAVVVGEESKNPHMATTGDFAGLLGLDYEYANGFVRGFDGGAANRKINGPIFLAGYGDGRAAWEAVQREGLVDVE